MQTKFTPETLAKYFDQTLLKPYVTEERLREVSLAIEEKSKEFNSIMDQKMKILQQNRKELNIHRK